MTVWIKQGVMGDLSNAMSKGLNKIAKVYEDNHEYLFITSIREGNHQPGSLHYRGDAVDFKTRNMPKKLLTAALGPDYDVVCFTVGHTDYYHVEYDPKEAE